MGLADAIASARTYDLEQPRYAGSPVFEAHQPGFHLFLHRRHEGSGAEEPRTSASALIVTTEHCGTHIDALCHQAENGKLCDGTPVAPGNQGPQGISHLDCESIRPIICRGVLADVPGALDGDEVPELIGEDLVREALGRAGTSVEPGDAVLVRTGAGAYYSDPPRYEAGPGIAPSASAWIAAQRPCLAGADNLAWDRPGHRDPELGCTLPGHVHLICRAGAYIVESLALEELAADGVAEFTFVCLPLKMRGATGSPVRPLALVG